MEIINILDKLKEKYKGDLRDNIISVSIIQSRYTVSVEVISLEILEDGLKKESIQNVDLSMITENKNGKLTFDPADTIEINVRKFINEISPAIIMCIAKIFNEEYCDKLRRESKFIVV